jgi:hypothetical protein
VKGRWGEKRGVGLGRKKGMGGWLKKDQRVEENISFILTLIFLYVSSLLVFSKVNDKETKNKRRSGK